MTIRRFATNLNTLAKERSASIKALINDRRSIPAFEAGIDLCGHVVDYGKNPSWSAAVRVGLSVTKSLLEYYSAPDWADDYVNDDWSKIDLEPSMINIIYQAAIAVGKTTLIVKSKDDIEVRKVDVPFGCTYMFFSSMSSTNNSKPYCMFIDHKHAHVINVSISHVIKTRHLNHKTLVLQKNDNLSEGENITLVNDEFNDLQPSEASAKIVSTIKRYLEANIHRSIMIYGIAGSGKSTISRVILKELDFNVLRFKVEDIGSLNVTSMKMLVDCIMPDAIIIDDFDRALDQRRLLELMENLKKTVKLVIATVNNRDLLDEAIMRPGRFDELIEINTLDPVAVHALLGEYDSPEVFEAVKEWPVAFINEYVIRRRIMNDVDAINSIAELTERIKRLNEYKSYTPVEQVNQLVKTNKNTRSTRFQGVASRSK